MKENQFLPLFRNEFRNLPFWSVLYVGLGLSLIVLIEWKYKPNYDFSFEGIGMFAFALNAFIAMSWILTPWLWGTPWWGGAQGTLDTREFMLTRAIDRKVYSRAKGTVSLLVVLLPFLLNLGAALYQPKLVIEGPISSTQEATQESKQKRYLESFHGSYTTTDDHWGFPITNIVIPKGRVIKAFWNIWRMLFMVTLFQGLLVWISQYQRAKSFFWITFYLLLGLQIIPGFLGTEIKMISWGEVFLFFNAHKIILFFSLAVFILIIQILCERHFEKMEVL